VGGDESERQRRLRFDLSKRPGSRTNTFSPRPLEWIIRVNAGLYAERCTQQKISISHAHAPLEGAERHPAYLLLLSDNWFDAIEDGIRSRVRGFIEAMMEEELSSALSRPRYGRRKPGEDGTGEEPQRDLKDGTHSRSRGLPGGAEGIRTDGHQRVRRQPQFSHMFVDDFKIVANNMTGGNLRTDDRQIPVSGSPIRLRLTSACLKFEARRRGIPVRVGKASDEQGPAHRP